ncbi:unnamed protein product [Moneuplotes crassus]|uniref:Uncharacterized protein n=1 Tax=Euplotes crassus TaxID=5936 RepID=A0AAD2D8Y2_EUPCR|nr:unnamed protein product [Moneuplotes crassus]
MSKDQNSPSQSTQEFAMRKHADRLKSLTAFNPFQNDLKCYNLAQRTDFEQPNHEQNLKMAKSRHFSDAKPDLEILNNCEEQKRGSLFTPSLTNSLSFDPRSVKGDHQPNVSSKGDNKIPSNTDTQLVPVSVTEVGASLDAQYELLRQKKEELLLLQKNVENSLENIHCKITGGEPKVVPDKKEPEVPIEVNTREHRRNNAFVVCKPNVRMIKSKYVKASKNMTRNTPKVGEGKKGLHFTKQSIVRGRKGKRKSARKLENQTVDNKRDKNDLKKNISSMKNNVNKRENTDPKKTIRIMENSECKSSLKKHNYPKQVPTTNQGYLNQDKSKSIENRNNSSNSRSTPSVRRDRATRNRDASANSSCSKTKRLTTPRPKTDNKNIKSDLKKNNEAKTPVKSTLKAHKKGGKEKKSRGKSSYKKSYSSKLTNVKTCKALSVKIIKQLSTLTEHTYGVEKILRNFSELISVFDNPRYKICEDIFEKWIKLTSDLRTSAKTNLTDVSAEVPKSYRMKLDGTFVQKPQKDIKTRKRRDSVQSSSKECLLQTSKAKNKPSKKEANISNKEGEVGISRSMSKPFLNQEKRAKYHCNILVDKDENILSDHHSSSLGETPCDQQDKQIVNYQQRVKPRNLESNFNDEKNILLSPPNDSCLLDDSEYMDEPNQFPPVLTRKDHDDTFNFSITYKQNVLNASQYDERGYGSHKDKPNSVLFNIRDKENTQKSIFEHDTSNECSESPVKGNSTKLSKWVENVKQEKYQSEIYSKKFDSKRFESKSTIKQISREKYPQDKRTSQHRLNLDLNYDSSFRPPQDPSHTPLHETSPSSSLKFQKSLEAEERMDKILFSPPRSHL